jgi:hypothetical protein
MKKVLVVLGLAMSAFSFQASAATFNLGAVNDDFNFSHKLTTADKDVSTKTFSDTWNFTAPANGGIGVSATNTWLKLISEIQNFSATLDGIDLDKSSSTIILPNGVNSTTQVLLGGIFGSAAGHHKLVISGTTVGSYGGSIAVAQTPIPAAIWLFGSALMGLTGMSRRKSTKA